MACRAALAALLLRLAVCPCKYIVSPYATANHSAGTLCPVNHKGDTPCVVRECQVKRFAYDKSLDAIKSVASGLYSKNTWPIKYAYLLTSLKRRVLDRKVPGAILELGVASGPTSRILRRMISAFSADTPRELHVYDSFEGLPSRDAKDGFQLASIDGKGGMSYPVESYKQSFARENLTLPEGIHKGFFGDVPDEEYPQPVAFAFFDGDLYSSISDSFKKVYHKLSPGAVVMLHDWFPPTGRFPGPKLATDEFLADKPEKGVIECHGNIALLVKQ